MRDSRPSGMRDSHPGVMRDSRPGGMRDSRSGGMRDSRPGGMRDSRSGGMSDATRRNGNVYVSKKEEATWQVFGRIPQVGGFSADHHLGSGWLCKRFRAVIGGCITTKGKTVG